LRTEDDDDNQAHLQHGVDFTLAKPHPSDLRESTAIATPGGNVVGEFIGDKE
jgi:hypothetical protein